MPFKAVLFDLDETLIDDAAAVEDTFRATCEIATGGCGLDPRVLNRAAREACSTLFRQLSGYPTWKALGLASWEVLSIVDNGRDASILAPFHLEVADFPHRAWTLALETCGTPDVALAAELVETFRVARRRSHRLFPDAVAVLERLRGDFPLVLITNGASSLQREKIDSLDLARHFEHIVVSGEFGAGKPDSAIFRHALSLVGAAPGEAVLVGDSVSRDVAGGAAAGVPVIWVNRNGADEELRAAGHRPFAQIASLTELLPALSTLLRSRHRAHRAGSTRGGK